MRRMLIALTLVTAAGAARADDKPLATVGTETITEGNLRSTAQGIGARGQMAVANPATRRQLVDQMIDNRLMAREGAARGLENSKEYKNMLAEARVNILAGLYQKAAVEDNLTDAKLRAFFKENGALFSAAKIHAAHVQVKDEATAKTVLAEALKGTDFAALAKTYSQAAGANKGGDLGWFARGRMLPEFEEVAFSCKPGICPSVAKTQFGFHVIKIFDVKDGGNVAYEQVQEKVRQAYERRLKADVAAQLRAKTKVTMHDEALNAFKM